MDILTFVVHTKSRIAEETYTDWREAIKYTYDNFSGEEKTVYYKLQDNIGD